MKHRSKIANRPPVVLLYGLDEASQPFEVTAINALVEVASEALRSQGWRCEVVQLSHDLLTPLQPYSPGEWVTLNLCEGSPTQDFYYARVAHVLTALGYTYTGSDDRTLDQSQFKWQMKSLMRQHGVPTPAWALFSASDAGGAGDAVAFDTFPAIVKPAAEHCSYGITRDSVVMNLTELRAQVERVTREFDGQALVEEFLDSAEYNVSVLGSDEEDARVLGISTMTYDAFADIHDRLCTFEAKWDPASAAYQRIPAICPAPVSPELQAEIERVAIGAYLSVGCRDYGRVDLRLRNGQPMAFDVNANCDVSPDGGFANAARAAGLSYAQMFEHIILSAVARREKALARHTAGRLVAEPVALPLAVAAG
jgi:D-alanine-D-alanine ligase